MIKVIINIICLHTVLANIAKLPYGSNEEKNISEIFENHGNPKSATECPV